MGVEEMILRSLSKYEKVLNNNGHKEKKNNGHKGKTN